MPWNELYKTLKTQEGGNEKTPYLTLLQEMMQNGPSAGFVPGNLLHQSYFINYLKDVVGYELNNNSNVLEYDIAPIDNDLGATIKAEIEKLAEPAKINVLKVLHSWIANKGTFPPIDFTDDEIAEFTAGKTNTEKTEIKDAIRYKDFKLFNPDDSLVVGLNNGENGRAEELTKIRKKGVEKICALLVGALTADAAIASINGADSNMKISLGYTTLHNALVAAGGGSIISSLKKNSGIENANITHKGFIDDVAQNVNPIYVSFTNPGSHFTLLTIVKENDEVKLLYADSLIKFSENFSRAQKIATDLKTKFLKKTVIAQNVSKSQQYKNCCGLSTVMNAETMHNHFSRGGTVNNLELKKFPMQIGGQSLSMDQFYKKYGTKILLPYFAEKILNEKQIKDKIKNKYNAYINAQKQNKLIWLAVGMIEIGDHEFARELIRLHYIEQSKQQGELVGVASAESVMGDEQKKDWARCEKYPELIRQFVLNHCVGNEVGKVDLTDDQKSAVVCENLIKELNHCVGNEVGKVDLTDDQKSAVVCENLIKESIFSSFKNSKNKKELQKAIRNRFIGAFKIENNILDTTNKTITFNILLFLTQDDIDTLNKDEIDRIKINKDEIDRIKNIGEEVAEVLNNAAGNTIDEKFNTIKNDEGILRKIWQCILDVVKLITFYYVEIDAGRSAHNKLERGIEGKFADFIKERPHTL